MHLSSFLPSDLLLLSMQAFITATAGMKEYNDVRGKMFEPLAHRIVGGGGSFDVWDLEMGVCAAPLLDMITS